MQGGPLAGIRVIDLTTVVLGPFATQLLGDMGADVIKVESPDGDNCRWIGPSRTKGMGSYFAMLNRNKRSVVLDLKRPAARDALLRLVDGADVFVHNMRLGAAERLGLGYASLVARNQRLVYASASGFRRGSSKQDDPAFDDMIQGMSGLAALNAGPDGAPRYVPSVVVDKLTGQMLASMIGMALFHRERTGQGQEVHVPMLETMLSFLLVEHLWGAAINQPELGLGYPRMLTPHRRPYATRDGYISVIAVSDAHWGRLFEAMGRHGADRRPALRDDCGTVGQRGCAVCGVGGRDARAHDGGMAVGPGRARHPLRAGEHAGGPPAGRISARDRILPAYAASARRRGHPDSDTGAVFRQSAVRAQALAGVGRAHPGGLARDRLQRPGNPDDRRLRLMTTA